MAKCYYNGILLPEIPADVLASYPYCWIRDNGATGNYDLVVAPNIWYHNSDRLSKSVAGTYPYYSISKSAYLTYEYWPFNANSDLDFGLDSSRTVLWANFDVPEGSATATEIYFSGSEPIPEGSDVPEQYVETLSFTDDDWKNQRPDCIAVTDGATPFFVSNTLPYNDSTTLRSGAISHNGTSEITIAFTLANPGSIEFNYTVSSEGNYDWLWAYIDGTQVVKVSGTVAWTVFSKILSAGSHTLTLKYTKDGSGNTGNDAGAIGYIKFWGMAKPYDKRYLIRSEAVVYTVVDGALSALETSDVTAELFRSSGIEGPPTSELLVTLTDPEILYWVDTTEYPIDEVKVIQTAIPFPQTLESPDYFMSDETVLGIEKAVAVATESVQFAVSFDSGATWKTFIDGAWAELSETASGMSATTLNSIPTESWNAMATDGKFRFRISLMDETSEFTSLIVDYLNEAEVPAESNEGDK